jgi:hypothetical protein
MDLPSSPPPKYEPGGDRLLIVVALIVVTGLGGMTWSFLSRQSVQRRAPVVVPHSSKPIPVEASKPAPRPAPTLPARP